MPNTTHQPEPLSAAIGQASSLTRSAECRYVRPSGDPCGQTFVQAEIFKRWSPEVCTRCADEIEAIAEQKAAIEARNKRRDDALKALDVPLLYRDATLSTFRFHGANEDRHRQGRVMQLARRYMATWPARQSLDDIGAFPIVAIFRGGPGSGKGHVAWSIAKHVALEEHGRVVFTTLADCVRDLRETWRRDSEASENQRLRRYRSADLLVLDEVSAHAFYGEPTQHLYALVAWREERLMPTILTTNETPDGLSALLGPALESRAAGWNGVWSFGDSDYRVERRNQLRVEAAAA